MEREAMVLRRQLQDLRQRRNDAASSSGSKAGDAQSRRAGSEVKKQLKELEPRLVKLNRAIQALAVQLPNTSHRDSPVGSEDKARVVQMLGPRVPDPAPEADGHRDHVALSAPGQLGWTDFVASATTTGASWPLLTNAGALLELALVNYAMSVVLGQRGGASGDERFIPVLTPDVVRNDIAERCGFQPRDGEAQQTYFLSDGTGTPEGETGLCLAGTAEVPLVAMSAGTTFDERDLPRKFVALGRAFRAEAGARGADSRGLYRVHQFSKVEMVVVCAERDSERQLEDLRRIQTEILSSLGLSLRCVV